MRILYLTEESITFSGTMVRGGQIHVRNVVRGLRKRGHNVHLIDRNETPERAFQHSIFPRTRFVVDPLRTFFRAVSVGQELNSDVIISKTRKTYLPGLAASRYLDIPHIVHVGSSPEASGDRISDQIDTASVVSRLKAPHDGYFVVCNALATDMERLGVSKTRIFDVKNAVDTERFHPDHVPILLDKQYQEHLEGFIDNKFTLGFVGGLQPYKGLDDLASALDKTTTHCGVIIAGDGPERERLTHRFGRRARFLGAVPYEQIPAIYQQIDCLILPSHTEGLPRVVLEAQAAGVPVIASRVGGVPEIIDDGETGLLFDPKSPEQLATTIDEVVDNSELRSHLAESGRREVVESYRWESLYKRYDRFLRELLTSWSEEQNE